MRPYAMFLGAGLLVALGLHGGLAQADVPTNDDHARLDSDTRRLTYMDSVLAYYQVESSRFRTWNAVIGIARGAVSIPVGGFVLSQDFVASGFVMVANGGISAASGLLDLVFFREPFEELRANFLARRASGASVEEVLDRTESEWVAKANAVRKARIRSGVLSTAVGALLVGIGAGVGFDGLTLTSESATSTDRATIASLFVSFGGMNLATGLRSLLVADPIENGWQSYTRARSVWGQTRFHFVALRSGGYLGLSTMF